MKCLISLIVIFELAVGFGTDVLPRNCIQEQILDILSQWRSGGIPPLLPPLEVITIDSVEGLYEGFGIQVTYVSGDMRLTGANNFTIEKLYVSTDDLKGFITVRFPLLNLTAEHYSLNGLAYYIYHLKGVGLMNVIFQNIEVNLGLALVPKGLTDSEIDDVNLDFSVGNIQVSLADSSWPINKVLNSNALNMVKKHKSELITFAKAIIKNTINELLVSVTPSQVWGIVDTDCDSLRWNYIQ